MITWSNESVVGVEKKLTEDYRKEIEERLRLKKQELESHIGSAPAERPDPGQSSGDSAESARIGELSAAIAAIDAQVGALELEAISLRRTSESLRQAKQSIKRAADALMALRDTHRAELSAAGLSFDQIVRLELDYVPLDAAIAQKVAIHPKRRKRCKVNGHSF